MCYVMARPQSPAPCPFILYTSVSLQRILEGATDERQLCMACFVVTLQASSGKVTDFTLTNNYQFFFLVDVLMMRFKPYILVLQSARQVTFIYAVIFQCFSEHDMLVCNKIVVYSAT